MVAIDFNFNETCLQEQPHPAGYPAHLFANTVAEGYELIQNGTRKFVFVRQPFDAAMVPPVPSIPDLAGLSQSVVVYYQYNFEGSPLLEGLSNRFENNVGFANTRVGHYYAPEDHDPGYSELYDIEGPQLRKDRWRGEGLNPKMIQNAAFNYSQLIDFQGDASHYISALNASAQQWWHSENVSYLLNIAIKGHEILPETPYWHIDPADPLIKGTFGANLLSYWYGPGTVYCEHNVTIGRQYTKKLDRIATGVIDYIQMSDPTYQDSKFNGSYFRAHVKESILEQVKLGNNTRLSEIILDYPNELQKKLLDPLIDVVVDSVRLKIRDLNRASPRTREYLQNLSIDRLCEEDLNGKVYATPPGYLSIHAISTNLSYGAVHRSPLEASARWGLILMRALTPSFDVPLFDESVSDY